MRSTSWIKHPVIFLFGAAIAAGCGSDSKSSSPGAEGDGSTCNNDNHIDTGEECDGTALPASASCKTAAMGMYTGGTLKCGKSCKFDYSACTKGGGGAGGGGGKGGQGGAGGSVPLTGGAPGHDGGLDGSVDGSMDSSTPGTDSGTPKTDSGSHQPVDSGQKG